MIELRTYITAGNATFTVQSRKTGKRFTYRVRRKKEGIGEMERWSKNAPTPQCSNAPTPQRSNALWFVSVMNGTDNNYHYEFVGTITEDGAYRHGKKSRYMATSPCSVAFAYLMQHIDHISATQLDLYPSGTCCRCGRLLTTPESISLGIGPECKGRIGGQHESHTKGEPS